MKSREFVDHILSGPVKLVLGEPLRFRRRTRSNPCDFNEFLQALQSSETIRNVRCRSHRWLGITEDEWVLLVKTLGSIKGNQSMFVDCAHSSHDFHPFQAVVEALKSAHSLRELTVRLDDATFLRDSSGLPALANAVREYTGLQEFSLVDFCPLLEGAQSTAFDSMLQELSACPHLQRVHIHTKRTSADAIRNLLQLPTDTELTLALTPVQRLAAADEIRLGRCLIKALNLILGA
jgi:hypothetical protein